MATIMPGAGPSRAFPATDRVSPREGLNRRVYAALDLGTNNCRLLVARPARGGFYVVDAFSRVVRLGEGLLQSDRISDEAQDRAVEALKICADKIRRREVHLTRNVATEACRRASNGIAFVERVYEETGIALDVISAAEEARLAVLGCQTLLANERQSLVFDIGGGSTELILVDMDERGKADIRDWVSVPWGVVSLAETEHGDLPDSTARQLAYDRMRARVTEYLSAFTARIRPMITATPDLLGTSGTVTTLASLHLGLPNYDRRQVDGCFVPSGSMREISARLAWQSPAERAMEPCIGHERAELVVAGCAILDAILAIWPADQIRVADRGIREGILRTLMNRDGHWV